MWLRAFLMRQHPDNLALYRYKRLPQVRGTQKKIVKKCGWLTFSAENMLPRPSSTS